MIDGEPYIFANGKYNPDASAIDIEWFTESEINTFEIWESYDNNEYVPVDTVMDTDSYQYILTEDFEKKYFKVSFIEDENSVVESIPFSVVKTEDGYEIVLLDTDEDGLADMYEMIFGTDPQSADTDGDTLSDYQEVYITRTDPTVYDSVTEGVSDADADSDGDEITNADEIDYGTNPQLTDTDGDALSDYDEIYVYGTDPLKDDSDGDGLKDSVEIKLGLDPNNPQTFDIPDSEYQIAQPISPDNDILSSVNTEDSPYIMSIDITSNNDIEENIFVSESEYSGIIENNAIIGKSIDISAECSPSSMIVNFAVSDEYINNTLGTYNKIERFKGIKRLAVFKYFDEINALLPLCTEYDTSTNTVSAVIEDDGTYCIIDTEIWLDELEITADDLISEETTSPMSIKSPSVNILSAKKASSIEKIGKGASGNFFENKPVDLVFAIQNSGFGEEAKQKFEFEKTLIRDISDYAFKNYKDVRVHLVSYNIQWDIQNASIDGMPFFLDINQVETALDKIEYIPNLGVSNRALGHYLAFINAGRLSYRQNAERFIYNFTNYSTYFQDALGNYSYDFQSVYDYFWRNDMHYSQVIEGGNNFDSFLNKLINGDYSDPRCDSSILPNLIGHDGVDLTLDTTTENNYNDIIKSLNQHIEKTLLYGAYSPLDWKKKILGAELAEDKPFDTDGDSVPDWEEIDKSKLIMYEDGSFDLPTINYFINLIKNDSERESVLNFLYGNTLALSSESCAYSASSERNSSMADVVLSLKVLPTVSDPTAADSDNDGYTDVDDPEPYNPPKYLNGKYDFLDGEIYSLLHKTSFGMLCYELFEGSAITNTKIVSACYEGREEQKFRFKWHESEGGYTLLKSSYMKKQNTFYPIILSIVFTLVIGFVLLKLWFDKVHEWDNTYIKVTNIYDKKQLCQVGDEYFFAKSNGVYTYGNNEPLIQTSEPLICSKNNILYVYSDDIITGYTVDLKKTEEFKVGNLMAFSVANEKIITFDTDRKLHIYNKNDMSEYNLLQDSIKLDDETLTYFEIDNMKIFEYRTGYAHSIPYSNEKYAIINPRINASGSLEKFNYNEFSEEDVSLSEYRSNAIDYIHDNDTIIGILSKVSISPHDDFKEINNLKKHFADMIIFINADSMQIEKIFETKEKERVLFANKDTAVTFFKGKYITYSLDNLTKISSQKATEIQKGNSYYFQTCGDYIFIFDNSENVINRISVL